MTEKAPCPAGCDDGMTCAECADDAQHAHFSTYRWPWHWPQLTVYVPADTHPRMGLNRYPHAVIGAAVVVFGRCWAVKWKGDRRTRHPREVTEA